MLNRTVLTAAIAAVAVSSVALADPFDPKVVPADAKWVLHADVDAVSQSALWPYIQKRIDAAPHIHQGIAQVEQWTGMTLPQDLHSVTLVGMGFADPDGVILFHAKVNQEQLMGALQMNPSYSSTPHGSHEIVSWEDKGKVNYGSFYSADRIVIGQNKDNVAKVLDVLDGAAPAAKADSPLAQPAADGTLVLVASDALTEMAQQKDPKNPVLKNFQSGRLALSQVEKNITLLGTFGVSDEKKAQQMKAMADGLKAAGVMMATQENTDPKLKALAPLLPGAEITAKGNTVQLNWTEPADALTGAIDELHAARASKTTKDATNPQ